MSGHANFSAIDGVRPTLPAIQPTGEDIGVSLNKSVGGVKASGAADVGGVNEEVAPHEGDKGAEKAARRLRLMRVTRAQRRRARFSASSTCSLRARRRAPRRGSTRPR